MNMPEITTNMGQYRIEFINLDPIRCSIIKTIMSNNWINSDDYRSRRYATPFLQGFDITSGWVLLEFWSVSLLDVKRFVEYLKTQLEDDARIRQEEEWSAELNDQI